MTSLTIDINADLGEGGSFDDDMFACISSANIACGAHAGDAEQMRRSVQIALEHSVIIGAHPGLADRERFGRVWFDQDPELLRQHIFDQVTALQRICGEEGTVLQYVKAHGALYNRAAADESIATVIARAISAVDPALSMYAQSGSAMERVATSQGLPVIREAFADRAINGDGSLVSRDLPDAVLVDPEAIAQRMISLIRTGQLGSIDGEIIDVPADTICIHSDTPGALDIARCLRAQLTELGIEIRHPT